MNSYGLRSVGNAAKVLKRLHKNAPFSIHIKWREVEMKKS